VRHSQRADKKEATLQSKPHALTKAPNGKGSALDISLLGVNHRTAGIALRGRLALTQDATSDLLLRLVAVAGEVVILSTCNRIEIYTVAVDDVTDAIRSGLALATGVPVEEIRAHSYALSGQALVHHLIGVSAGLDSMVIGEAQILGQVGDAWRTAAGAGTTGPVLNTLFRYAQQAGKDIHSRTVVSRGAVSIAHAAVEIARKELGSLTDRRVLVVGAGKTGQLAARNLRAARVAELLVTNRTYARAEARAVELGGTAIRFEDMADELGRIDAVIACASTNDPIITKSIVERAAAHRGDGPLLLIDIGVPRNIDIASRGIDHVLLYDMDDLQALCERNKHARAAAARAAKREVQIWTARFVTWQREREAVPLIRRMRADAEEMRARELQHALRSMPELTEQERAAVEKLSHSIVKKLLHQPTVSLRRERDEEQRCRVAAMWTVKPPRGKHGRDTDAT
jgi:glutamyl-tRNA reductase